MSASHEGTSQVPTKRNRAQDFQGGPSGPSSKARELMERLSDWLEVHQKQMQERDGCWGAWMLGLARGGVVPPPTPEFGELLLALDDPAEPQHGLGRYLSQIAPLGIDRAQAESKGVRITTMGRAKGLTVQATIVMAVEDGIIPRQDCDKGEERRLLYVAMTRTRKYQFATWAQTRKGQTARSGKAQVGGFRKHSHFFDSGPVNSQDGPAFLRSRWKQT